MTTKQLTAMIEREDTGYVSHCPELDVASQGRNFEEARDNLREALELFFECASPEEVARRYRDDLYETSVDVVDEQVACLAGSPAKSIDLLTVRIREAIERYLEEMGEAPESRDFLGVPRVTVQTNRAAR